MKITVNKLLVSGSRSIHNKEWIWSVLDQFKFKILVVGTTLEAVNRKSIEKYGVDEWAFIYARTKKRIKIISLQPDWEKLKLGAGVVRNSDMISCLEEETDKGIILWDGKSVGTFDTMQKLRKAKKLIHVFLYRIKTIESFMKK